MIPRQQPASLLNTFTIFPAFFRQEKQKIPHVAVRDLLR
ncbi:hypothetical protein GA0116948_10942 [Chitinophaga costaii]|uniref:Uncharacterized protein n=1 Tax=Chitinophaga costaii TaxID=1335309 RepID=A0A1C4EML6_9BACT|nr:hypothetical protein GA0116948_10942 [Chitinophaga costaii]